MNDVLINHYTLHLLAYGNFEKFEDLGFMINDKSEVEDVIKVVKDETLSNFLTRNRTNSQISPDISNFTVSELAKAFLESEKCLDPKILPAIGLVSSILTSQLNLEIFNDLEERDFDFFEKFITHNN